MEKADSQYQYLIVAAEPSENLGLKIQNSEMDRRDGKFFSHWYPDTYQGLLSAILVQKGTGIKSGWELLDYLIPVS